MMIIKRIAKTTSTIDYVSRYIKKRQDITVVADVQTGGKGTKGRSFSSGLGGLYMTELKFRQFFKAQDCFKIMAGACMAVVKTLKAFGIQSAVKWPNDVIVGGKKICGILINNQLIDGLFVDYSITGIGINVNNELPEELSDIAISMKQIAGKSFDVTAVLLTLMQNLSQPVNMQEYKKYSCVLNKPLTIVTGDRKIECVATDITDDGRLVLDNGEIIAHGEILFAYGKK